VGVGKTTVVDAFVHQLVPAEALWLGRGQCIEHYGAGEAYLPLLEALGELGRAPEGERLVACLRQYAPTWLGHLPALLSPEARAAVQGHGHGATPARMLRELAEALEALAAERPVVLVLEDLHWSDSSTVEALALLARRRHTARLLVLGTYRPGDLILHDHPLKTVKQDCSRTGSVRKSRWAIYPTKRSQYMWPGAGSRWRQRRAWRRLCMGGRRDIPSSWCR
jgi:hypothetical protein